MPLTPEEKKELELLRAKNTQIEQENEADDRPDADRRGEAFLQGGAQGLSFNMADEAAARLAQAMIGLDPGLNDVPYGDLLSDAREYYSGLQENSPVSYTVGSVAGSIPATVALAGAIPARLATQGAIIGAGQGFGTGEGDDAARSAVEGGTLGVLLGLAGKGLQGVLKPKNVKGAELAKRQYEKIKNSLPDDYEGQLMYASPQAAKMAESIAVRPNEGSEKIGKVVAENIASTGDDVRGIISERFPLTNVEKAKDELVEAARLDAGSKYKDAYDAVPEISDDKINEILDVVRRAGFLDEAESMAQKASTLRGQTYDPQKMGTRELDLLSRSIRDRALNTQGEGALGGNTTVGGALAEQAKALRGRLYEVNPKLKDAAGKFADDVQVKDAYDFGINADVFGKNYQKVQAEYDALAPNAKQAARLGLGVRFDNMISTNPMAALRRFNSEQFKKGIAGFYDNPAQIDDVVAQLKAKAEQMAVNRKITQQSATAGRLMAQAQDAAENGSALDDFVQSALQGRGPIGTGIKRGTDFLAGKLANPPKRQVADEILAELLTKSPSKRIAEEELMRRLLLANKADGTKKFSPAAAALQQTLIQNNGGE